MILNRIEQIEDGIRKIYLISPDGAYKLSNIHPESLDCYEHGCLVHFPTPTATANEEQWPYNWRIDRGIMERICPHGIGHPDPDGANYWQRIGQSYENIHACDGCDCS